MSEQIERRSSPVRRASDTAPCYLDIQAEIDGRLSALQVSVNQIKTAFVDDDMPGHRSAHQAMIDASKAQTEFWKEMKLDIAKKGTWALIIIILGFITAGMVAWFSAKLGIAPK